MAILVRLWGQVAAVSPGTRRQLIDSKEASSLTEAKMFAEQFRLAVINRTMSWPVNTGISHIDFGFQSEKEARAYKSGLRDVYPMGNGIFSTVEHHF